MLSLEMAKKLDVQKVYTTKQLKEYIYAYNEFYHPEGADDNNNKFNYGKKELWNDILYISKENFLNKYENLKLFICALRYGGGRTQIVSKFKPQLIDIIIPSEHLEEFEEIFNKIIDKASEKEQDLLRGFFTCSKSFNYLKYDIFCSNLRKVYEQISFTTLVKILQFNIDRYYKQMILVQKNKISIYSQDDSIYSDDEKSKNIKKTINEITPIKTKIGDIICEYFELNEEMSNRMHYFIKESCSKNIIHKELGDYALTISDVHSLESIQNKKFYEFIFSLGLVETCEKNFWDNNTSLKLNKLKLLFYNEGNEITKEKVLDIVLSYKTEKTEIMDISDFNYIQKEVDDLQKLINSKNGSDILIWGRPGLGKTEMVKSIAKANNKDVLYLYEAGGDFTEIEVNSDAITRMKGLKKIAKTTKKHIVLIDEAEEILKDVKLKGVINKEMETKDTCSFWLVNDLEQINPAIMRRFDYILEMNDMPFDKREEVASKMLGKNNKDGLSLKLAQAMNTPAEIKSAINLCELKNDYSWSVIANKIVSYQNVLSKSTIDKNGGFEIKVYSPNKNQGFNAFAGYDYVKREIIENFEILKSPAEYKKMNAKIPKGLLLMGSAGVGKSLLARSIANEYEMNLVTAKSTELANAPERIKYLFDKAKLIAPCIIFLDELDVLGSDVIEFGIPNTKKQKILNSLLVEMDGVDKFSGVLVIGATHRSDSLDASLLRNGRFGKKVLLRSPERKDREEIIQFYLKEKERADNIDYKSLARMTQGLSSADLAESVNEACLKAVKRRSSLIEHCDMVEAIDEIYFGVKTDGLPITTKEKWMTAIHEAGHALVAMKNDQTLQRATIRPHYNFLGMVQMERNEGVHSRNLKDVLSQIQIFLAGMVAEKVIFGVFSNGNTSDIYYTRLLMYNFYFKSGASKSLGLLGFDENMISEQKKEEIENELLSVLQEQEEIITVWLKDNQNKLVDFAKLLYLEKSLDYDFMKKWKSENFNTNKDESIKEDDEFQELLEMAYAANGSDNNNSEWLNTMR